MKGDRSYESLEKRALKKLKASALINIDGKEYRLWIVKNASKSDKEPLIYLLTNILDKRNTPDLYRLRWKIEYLFKHLKSNGYNLEDLRLKDIGKIRLMIAIVVLAYIIAICQGLEERKKKPMKTKVYKNQMADAMSVFKQGQSIVKQAFVKLSQLIRIIKLFADLQNVQ